TLFLPLSLNRYVYSMDDPVNHSDPNGNDVNNCHQTPDGITTCEGITPPPPPLPGELPSIGPFTIRVQRPKDSIIPTPRLATLPFRCTDDRDATEATLRGLGQAITDVGRAAGLSDQSLADIGSLVDDVINTLLQDPSMIEVR